MIRDPDLRQHLPLTEVTFYILLSLVSGEKHGYAIMKEIQQLSDDRVVLSTGTLYGALKRLLEAGWIERVESPVLDESARETKAYQLTVLGERVLEAETTRLRRLVQLAHERAPWGTP
jgi:DNA-binding PadR family transcriptional regulator